MYILVFIYCLKAELFEYTTYTTYVLYKHKNLDLLSYTQILTICYKMALMKKLFAKKKVMETSMKEKTVNILVMGKAAVGKTSLIWKLVGHGTFLEEHIPTLYDDLIKEVNVDDYKVTFKFMELGGTQAFPTMLEIFIQQADIYLLVYSADDIESHQTLISLREKVVSVKKKCYSELPIIVVRNKADIRRRCSRHDKVRRKSVSNWCYLNHDVSSKTGHRLNSIMDNLIEESKFIGNKQDENHFNISGRYIYNEKEDRECQLYHKTSCMFYHTAKLDKKINKRSLKLHNKKKEISVNERYLAASPPPLKRSLGLTLRQSVKWFRGNNNGLPNHHESLTDEIISGSNRGSQLIKSVKAPCTEHQLSKSAESNFNTNIPSVNISGDKYFDVCDTPDCNVIVNDKPKSTQLSSFDETKTSMKNSSNNLQLRRQSYSTHVHEVSSLDESKSAMEIPSNSFSVWRRRCSTLIVPTKDSTHGTCVEGHKTIPMFEQVEKSIGKSASFSGRKQLLADGCVRRSGSMRDYTKSMKCFSENRNDILQCNKNNLQEGVDTKEVLQSTHDFQKSINDFPEKIDINESINNFPNNINGTINSPCMQKRTIPWMRLKSLSQNNISNMFTVNIPKPEQRRRSNTIFKSCKFDTNHSSNKSFNTFSEQKRFSGSFKGKFNLKGYQQKLKNFSETRCHSDSFSDKQPSLTSQQVTMDFTDGQCNSDSNKAKVVKGKQIKSLSSDNNASFDGNISRSQSSPMPQFSEQPIKGSCEAQGPSDIMNKKGAIGLNMSNYGKQAKMLSLNLDRRSNSQLNSIRKNHSYESTYSLKTPLQKKDSYSLDDIRNIPSSYEEKVDYYQNNTKIISLHPTNSGTDILFKKSVIRVNKQETMISQAKHWLKSLEFII